MKKAVWLSFLLCVSLAAACSNSTTTETGGSTASNAPAASTTSPATTDADNTARNAGSASAPTPIGQSENATDLQISASIRKAILDDKSLSVNAQNIKIITASGEVTLRGPVKTEEERRNIEAKARNVAGVTMVNNLLEVERNP